MTDAEFEDLYERYGALVQRRAVALLGNVSDADDARQDVFLRIKKYGVPLGTQSLIGWLYKVTANVCFDKIGKHRLEDPVSNQDLMTMLETATPEAMSDLGRRAMVGAILRRVDPDLREVGLLYYLDGLTQEEVAQEARLTRKTVGKKLKRFESFFAQLLGKRADPEVP